MSKPLLLVLGDQLSLSLSALKDAPPNAVVAMCEVADEARYVPHHIHKIGLFMAAMRHFAQTLRDKGFQVHYSRIDDADNTQSLINEAERIAKQYGCNQIRVTRPGEWRLWDDITARKDAALPWKLLEDERLAFQRCPSTAKMSSPRKRSKMHSTILASIWGHWITSTCPSHAAKRW